MTQLTPAIIAAIDQERAALEMHLDALAETRRRLVAKNGTIQGEADLVAFLPTAFNDVALAGLLMTALARLDKAEDGVR